jgi:hypothetical protein
MNDRVPAAPMEEARICELVGDRACAKCSFNLSGQSVVREPHYGMLMVRCPECGTPAALQEYPLLGRWANRFGYLMAGAWLAIMITIVSLAALAIWGMSEEMTQQLATPYTQHVQKVWTEHVNGSGPPNPYAYTNYQQNQQWWDALDKRQLFADAGGWLGAVAWGALWFMLDMLLVMGSIGAILAVVMPHLRWKGRAVLTLFITALAASFAWVSMSMNQNVYSYYGGVWNSWHELYPALFPLSAGFALAFLFLGMCVGRRIARALILLLLPPRLRGPLAFLWRADGKPTPRLA